MVTKLDQFYTRPELAEAYVARVIERWRDPDVLFVEPAAGTGAFIRPLLNAGKKVCALDIVPKAPQIIRSDFLQFDLAAYAAAHSAIVIVGNPPFGKNAGTAVQFFNRAAIHADEIAFIVPRTFRKMSVQNRLHPRFRLTEDKDLESRAFRRFGKPHDVPCAWQIWTRHGVDRPKLIPPSVDHLIGYTTPQKANFAMRRVGFYAGRITTTNFRHLSKMTHYFIRELMDGVIEALRSVNWAEIAGQTAGVRSLAKAEIAIQLKKIYDA